MNQTARQDAGAAWIGVDRHGLIESINSRFTEEFGWTAEAVVGRPLTAIMPPAFRDAHNLGFARFLQYGRASILSQPVRLPVLTADGETVLTETCIEAGRHEESWRFGATMAPVRD